MKLETLHQSWEKDSQFDTSQPDQCMRDVPVLHARYWRYFTDIRRDYLAKRQEYDRLRHLRMEYFTGRMDDTERLSHGWPVQPLRLVRQEVEAYLDSDSILLPLKATLDLTELKLKFLEDCIKSINNRGFLIKSFIDWQRFANGA